MAEVISTKQIINGLAGLCAMLLMWTFGAIIWPRLEAVPSMQTELALLQENNKNHEIEHAQIRSFIERHFSHTKTLYPFQFNSNFRCAGIYHISGTIRSGDPSGVLVDWRDRNGNYVCYPHPEGCTYYETDRSRSFAGSNDKLYTASRKF